MSFEGFEDLSLSIVARLSGAGWEQTTRGKESGVPELVFNNGNMRLSIFQSIEGRSLMLGLIDIESGGYLRFDIEYGESISSLLGIFVQWQSGLSIDNFQEMINEIAVQFPETFAEPFEGDEDSPWPKVIPRR
ncbi:hypothetical protein [Streptomyces malaysiensis]|uniref:hypothetical protein n=1 Tax=Streptomyces malaysiensis TaxID=92644 RepID=UPI002B2869B1|nr:hypothetical protein R8789_06030 [Streptomyces malaysiensis]